MSRFVSVFLLICAGSLATRADCNHETAGNDERCTLDAGAFLGLAIDTFAAGEYGNYVYSTGNAQSAGDVRESSVAGFDFGYRLRGWRVGPANDNYKRQLWVYGETIHGVRSADINCSTNKNLPTCTTSLSALGVPVNPGESVLYLIRNASSLEGYMGFRYEFAHLNDAGGLDTGSATDVTGTPANLYIKAQAGFLKVSGVPGSALDMDKIAIGAIATKGNYTGSYLDVGFGRNDVFQFNRRRRAIVDAYLERKIPSKNKVSFFAQMVVDTDLGRGSDSFQTYVGVNLDLTSLF